MKQYRIKTPKGWSAWRNIVVSIPEEYKAIGILTIQFNEALTIEESREFFKHYEVE